METVCKVINTFKPKSSKDSEGISMKVLKWILPSIALPITTLVNQSLATGIFPSNLKIAKIMPLQKQPNNCNIDNFRPISLLPSISKVIEKCVFDQVYEYFEKNKLLYDSQYGYRQSHSTETACLEIIDRLHRQLDQNKTPLCIFIDLSKAFDTLDHAILLSKLEYYGLQQNTLNWFRSYLFNRKQYVEIEGYKSDMRNVNTGVPQGSILGPLLFIIYMNDLNFVSKKFNAILFADDTTLNSVLSVFTNNNNITLSSKINNEINKLNEWMKTNKLSLNIKKTKFMIFRYPQKPVSSLPKLDIKIEGKRIEQVDQFKFLGITIHETLTWKHHIDIIRVKISKVTGTMRRLKSYINSKVLLSIYNTLILSHLHYGILCWGFDGHKLFKMQKKSIRVVKKSKYNSHTDPIFKSLKLLKINDIFKTQCLKFLYRLKNGTVPSYFLHNFLPTSIGHNHNTRNRELLQPARANKQTTKKSLRLYLPKLINEIPGSITNKIYTHTVDSFKKGIKSYLIGKYSLQCTKPNCYSCLNN